MLIIKKKKKKKKKKKRERRKIYIPRGHRKNTTENLMFSLHSF